MEKVEYYWAKVGETLARADVQTNGSGFFLAIALAYRMLASSEETFLNKRPQSAVPLEESVFTTFKPLASV